MTKPTHAHRRNAGRQPPSLNSPRKGNGKNCDKEPVVHGSKKAKEAEKATEPSRAGVLVTPLNLPTNSSRKCCRAPRLAEPSAGCGRPMSPRQARQSAPCTPARPVPAGAAAGRSSACSNELPRILSTGPRCFRRVQRWPLSKRTVRPRAGCLRNPASSCWSLAVTPCLWGRRKHERVSLAISPGASGQNQVRTTAPRNKNRSHTKNGQ